MSDKSKCSTSESPPFESIININGVLKVEPTRKYEELDVIGTGAYGTVYKARDLHNSGQMVALKKVKLPVTEDGLPLSTLREIALLRQLDCYRHPNIVRLLDVCHGALNLDRENQLLLFLVFEHVDQDLESFLKNVPCPLSQPRIRGMAYDIISGVDFLHSHRVVHRDLKPHNLLVTVTGRIKIADFGLAKTYDVAMKLTSVVVTLWYRPPEVLLGCAYNSAVDVWSAGCILAQLHTLQPLFPGTSEGDQLDLIFRTLGRPSTDQWPENASIVAENFPEHLPRDLEDVLPRAGLQAVSLIKGMLIFTPSERLTAQDCLEHPYFTEELLS